ncbi:deoxycytidine triphosphate deaminase [Thermocrinis albus DSM 14484]|uniref:dCTP deaminase, dUMP-forming n=1 Tax=Thermocrinis albus (strain DSM 14484 / JCM 11386 / HI 11/12) TaxID=638303 RepID=D3SPT8_THEAH|nr:dCTP deaminase [Thermocrinis albus]ADC89175.1 deoxycytidine triphosphate deaminase [Thermocrinis albus DSM 14484]
MILSDATIKELIERGELKVDPYEEKNIQASSIDLRLGDQLVFYRAKVIDPKEPVTEIEIIHIPPEGVLIEPKTFLLATTMEYIKLPDYLTAFVEGRSSLGRLGLFIENAGWVDAGFEGQITLELYNASNCAIKLYPGMRICQIVLARLDRPAEKPYRGKYIGQKGVVPSRIHMDFV